MERQNNVHLEDTGERMIPPREGEVSVVFARHQFVYQYALQYVAQKRVLDVGCGTGYGCKILGQQASSVLGIDHDSDAVAYSRHHFGAPNIEFQQANATQLELDQDVDVAVSFQVIEHVRDPSDFVKRLRQAVVPGGWILITTPNVKDPDAKEEQNPFHFSEMNYKQFDALLRQHFTTYDIKGVARPSRNWLRSMLSVLPFYQKVGLLLRRGSAVKKAAAKAMDLTSFCVIEEDVAERSLDLLAVCKRS